MKSTILTQSGLEFDVCNPDPDLIEIEDIAHALSHICRFTGHTKHFYSVAQHSYLCATLVPQQYALEALLHDAAEAYIGDVSSPLKAQLPGYKAIEAKLEEAIRHRFGLPAQHSPWVKEADLQMLAAEKAQLMPQFEEPWDILNGVSVPDVRISHPTIEHDRRAFMWVFRTMTEQAQRLSQEQAGLDAKTTGDKA